MPYSTNADLPSAVRLHLPPHAQDIYRAAFNHAFEAHCNDPRREEVAHRIAWAGVKRLYEKNDGFWIRKANPWSNAD
jgi:cation transport regulator